MTGNVPPEAGALGTMEASAGELHLLLPRGLVPAVGPALGPQVQRLWGVGTAPPASSVLLH